MWLYRIIRIVTSFFINIFWLERYSGVDNVPKKGGVIIAPNHQSWIDPFFLSTTLKKRRLYFLIGEFVYNNKLAKWGLNVMDHIPVNRFHEDKSTVYEHAKRILDNGGALVVFPEGRLTKDGYTQKGYKGVAKMALASKVDIVPAVIKDSYKIYPVHRTTPYWFRKKCCQVKYLERIPYQSIKDLTLEEIVHEKIMKEITKELGHEYNHSGFERDLKAN